MIMVILMMVVVMMYQIISGKQVIKRNFIR